MLQSWVRPVEQIVLPALESRIRVLGFTAPSAGAGVSTLAAAAAETLARSGIKVLLLDLTRPATDDSSPTGWIPGDGGARELVTRAAAGYDVLTAEPHADSRFLFNNSMRLRQTLAGDLASYATIIIDLPPLLATDAHSINPVAAALLCDSVMLVCANGRTSRAGVRAAVQLAKTSGVKLAGTVFNDYGAQPLAAEIAQSVQRRLRFAPGLAARLARWAQHSTLLRS